MQRRSVWRAAVLATALTLASCTGHTTVKPPTAAQLRERLLTADSLPAGVQISLQATMDDHPAMFSAGPDPCPDLVDAHSIIMLTNAPAATTNIAIRTNEKMSWSGMETLSSYPADGATKVISEIRSLVQQCPTVTGRSDGGQSQAADPRATGAVIIHDPLTTQFTVADGPKLGDESIRVQARTPSRVFGAERENDAIVIRSGNTLLVVDEFATTAQDSKLTDVATAAYSKLTAR